MKFTTRLIVTLLFIAGCAVRPAMDNDVRAGFDSSSMNIANLGQGNLGLPEPNYYSDGDESAKRIRDAYLTYVTRLLVRKEQLPRERRCAQWADQFLTDDLGRIYAARHFTPETRARALEMIENLRAALRTGVQTLPWMTDPTRQNALTKLDAIALKIGYPEKWHDYSSIDVGHTSLVLNVMQGRRKFAADGSLTDWWTPEDAARFDQAAACIAEQFSEYDLGGGLRMDGKLVLGESMADLGGLEIAYRAYMKSIEGKPRQVIGGLTPEQRFFVGWARIWAENETREAMEVKVKTDPHPVSRYRVNGPLSNLPEFAAAFGCSANDPMVRTNRCDVW